MTTTIVRHKVKSYDIWAPVFHSMQGIRAQHGCKEERVLRGVEDPNFVVVQLEWTSPEAARGYFTSKALKDGMSKAGVAEAPTIDILEDAR